MERKFWLLAACLGLISSCSDDGSVFIPSPDIPSCQTADDCDEGLCIHNRCVNLPDSCSSGELSCLNKTLYECKKKTWAYVEDCEKGCNADNNGCRIDSSSSHQVCRDNEMRCYEGNIQHCENDEWILDKKCQNGCNEETFRCRQSTGEDVIDDDAIDDDVIDDNACKDDDLKCEEDRLNVCQNKTWNTVKTCDLGCHENGKSCKGCEDGTTQCIASQLQQCQNGEWVDLRSCEAGCSDNQLECAITPDCTNGEFSCADGMRKECVEGTWNEGTACPNGCAADGRACADCTNGSVKCTDSKKYTCQGGKWDNGSACQNGCLPDGTACAVCKDKTTQCKNNKKQTCQSGKWDAGKTCDNGCNAAATDCAEPNQLVPTRYLDTDIHSPVTAYVVKQMRDIAAKSSDKNNSIFMKAGDSHYNFTFDGKFMKCFSKQSGSTVSLDGRNELQKVIDTFQSGKDSFYRDSAAAVGGKSTRDCVSGSPSWLTSEINSMKPRFAFFGYGTNDMGNGSYCHTGVSCPNADGYGYAWALQDYYRQLTKAMNTLTAAGVIPLITGITPRSDKPTNINYIGGGLIASSSDYPLHMVPAFNAVARGNAEAMQVPFFNIYKATYPLTNHGIGDGVHMSFAGSPCNFTATGLQYGVNQRNLGSIQMLYNAWNAVVNKADAPDKVGETFKGKGTNSDPYIVSSISFTHSGDTSTGGSNLISTYSCAPNIDESGNEYYYKLDLKSPKRLRMFALSSTSKVDVDIHLMRAKPEASACIARSDIMIQGSLAAGTYYITVDTFNNSGTVQAGKYLLGIVECDADDNHCNKTL